MLESLLLDSLGTDIVSLDEQGASMGKSNGRSSSLTSF